MAVNCTKTKLEEGERPPCNIVNGAGLLSCLTCGWSEDDNWFNEEE